MLRFFWAGRANQPEGTGDNSSSPLHPASALSTAPPWTPRDQGTGPLAGTELDLTQEQATAATMTSAEPEGARKELDVSIAAWKTMSTVSK